MEIGLEAYPRAKVEPGNKCRTGPELDVFEQSVRKLWQRMFETQADSVKEISTSFTLLWMNEEPIEAMLVGCSQEDLRLTV